ncbi:VRR-NUC domain-containing protein [Cladophialophora immunda]|nr:VRR-NUC domain-containing protein [Cladophialophora immunda]
MHNRLMGTRIPHPPSTNFHDGEEFPAPPAKRLKAAVSTGTASPKRESPKKSTQKRRIKDEIPDSEEEEGEENGLEGRADPSSDPPRATQLEATLPPVKTDEEAIEAYEAYKASEYAHDNQDGRDEDTTLSRLESRSWVRGRSSIYVDAFNLALDTVLDEEAHLFNEAELSLFGIWRQLSYEAQYLYVRLFLRKTSKWFRVKDLQYYSDVADMEAAVAELQKERLLPAVDEAPGVHPGELEPPEGTVLGETFTFAECSSEHIKTLDEASSLLLLDELKTLAKQAKVQGKNKRELLQNFRRTSGRQAGLGFKELRRTETQESGSAMSEDNQSIYDEDGEESSGPGTPNASSANRDAHFTKKILDRTGRCIRLSLTPLKLFERVHLVFYRSTEWTEKSLTTLILAKISRRNFPEYIVSRSTTIFESRALLLEFEASLRTQFRIDNILEFNGTPGRKALEEVKEIFEAVYPRWKALLAEEQRKEDRVYESGEGAYLRRFSPAWVYTRIVHKALHPLARFKEHLREHGLLNELLDQRLFHAARRGAWYQRKALLEEHYMHALTADEGRSFEANKKHWKRIALKTCELGLQDKECHVIYHYDLQKRVKKLEKQLRVPLREQHDFGHVKLGKAVERDVVGIKIEQGREDTPSRNLTFSRKNSVNTVMDGDPAASNNTKRPSLPNQPSNPMLGSKTVWLDHLDTDLPVSVESMCLSHYRHVLGYKGYHSEGGILRTIFGLLFYDILFFNPYIPNVFQTAYQTCPLDLHTDSFFSARMPEILARINQISNGEAVEIVQRVWAQEHERRTCIVGVRWDEFEKDDLLELVGCWEGQALGTVMLVMAQEYQSRGGGVPDLVLWKVRGQADQDQSGDNGDDDDDDDDGDHAQVQSDGPRHQAKGEILFAEVKSANDRLSDTQRLWISVLLSAGVKVELCHAVAGEIRSE